MARSFAILVFLLAPAVLLAQPDCTVTLSPASVSITSASWNGVINVTGSPSGCRWTATTNNPDWLSISFGTSGTTSGTVGYTAQSNANIASRSGTIQVNNKIFTVNQTGAACSFSVSPSSASASAGGSIGNFAVNTLAGCSWTAAATASWISITSGASGTGPGNVGYSVAANPDVTTRTGSIIVGSATFTITQGGQCSFTLSPVSANAPAAGLTGTINVTASSGNCDRTATSNVSWITISLGASGIGNGTVGYTVAANNTPAQRSGTITIGNQTFTVTQSAADCSFSLFPTTISAPVAGASGRINVTTTCAWTAISNNDWIQISSGASGTGNGSISYSVSANSSAQPRTGSISVGSAAVSVTQQGIGCNVGITPASATVGADGGSGSIDVSAPAGCSWTAASAAGWITLNSGQSGSGEGIISWTAAANTTPASRNGTITIGGQVFTLTQSAASCNVALNPSGVTAPSTAGTYTINLSTTCTWTAASNVAWITLPSGSSTGTGNAVVTYSVAANPSAQPRTGTITIGGQAFTVTQNGFSCTYSLSPATMSLPGSGGPGQFRVTSANGCAWSPVTGDPWITLTSWSNVNGGGMVNFSASYNNYLDARTGTISVAGQAFTVTQAGGGPQVAQGGVVNGASFVAGPVAPGEIVSIFGNGLGPAKGAALQVADDQQSITSLLASTRVLFDDIPAPMIYTLTGQLSAVVPYAISGRTSTEMKVEYLGVRSPGVTLDVAASAPAIFTMNSSGTGAGAILNYPDNSLNSAANAIARGGIVLIFATGDGDTDPAGFDGRIVGADLPRTKLPVSVRIGGQNAPVLYSGGAPGLVSGVVQINVRVPANAPVGPAAPVVVRIGNGDSQAGVTMAVK